MDATIIAAGPAEPGLYVDWGVVQISATNLAIVVAMLVVFALALVVPFGRGHARDDEDAPR